MQAELRMPSRIFKERTSDRVHMKANCYVPMEGISMIWFSMMPAMVTTRVFLVQTVSGESRNVK